MISLKLNTSFNEQQASYQAKLWKLKKQLGTSSLLALFSTLYHMVHLALYSQSNPCSITDNHLYLAHSRNWKEWPLEIHRMLGFLTAVGLSWQPIRRWRPFWQEFFLSHCHLPKLTTWLLHHLWMLLLFQRFHPKYHIYVFCDKSLYLINQM